MNLEKQQVFSIMESLLFMSPEPRSFSDFEMLFKGELSTQEIKDCLLEFEQSYNKKERGLYVQKVAKGWQFRTKVENKSYLLKVKPPSVFRLSKPSLEALSIIAFEQPCTKLRVDEVRGVDSGHLLRNLIEKELIYLAGQSDFPGKPSLYKTSKKFLETFGLEDLKDLPSEQELEELLGTEPKKEEKEDIQSVSETMNIAKDVTEIYKEDEKENKKIKELLKSFPSSVDFLNKKDS